VDVDSISSHSNVSGSAAAGSATSAGSAVGGRLAGRHYTLESSLVGDRDAVLRPTSVGSTVCGLAESRCPTFAGSLVGFRAAALPLTTGGAGRQATVGRQFLNKSVNAAPRAIGRRRTSGLTGGGHRDTHNDLQCLRRPPCPLPRHHARPPPPPPRAITKCGSSHYSPYV